MTINRSLSTLKEHLLDGSPAALSRLISRVEDRQEGYRDLMDDIYRESGDAWVIGITGPPGVGKSTLVDVLVDRFREMDLNVGIIAIDPSSPFSGGSVLGDRIRSASTLDDGVYFRSMSTRGNVGGLSSATYDTVYLMDAAGKDIILIETVGAGQDEVDIVYTADTVLVTMHPMAGDEVQTVKAGMMEIGDIFSVNKADLDGAARTASQVREMVSHQTRADGWTPPVVKTSSTEKHGIDDLVEALQQHQDYQPDTMERRRRRIRYDIRRQLDAALGQAIENRLAAAGGIDELVEEVFEEEESPYSITTALVSGDPDSTLSRFDL